MKRVKDMNILILCAGNLGSTARAGENLAFAFGGNDNKIDCINSINKPIDYTKYDAVVFGTNVRMGRFNKVFKRQIKEFKKSGSKAKPFAYIVGARTEKGEVYEKRASKKIGGGLSVFVGGELICENATKFERAVINSSIDNLQRHFP